MDGRDPGSRNFPPLPPNFQQTRMFAFSFVAKISSRVCALLWCVHLPPRPM